MRLVSAMAVLAMAAACGGAAATDSASDGITDASAHVRWIPGSPEDLTYRHQSGGSSALVDHGGPVLSASRTVAIYWGDQTAFPSDLQSGMAALLGGMGGSSYLGIGAQYMRGASISSTYGGALIDTAAPPRHAPHTSDLGKEVCKLVPNPDPSTIYVVFTSNAPKANYCAWHDKTSCNGVTFQVAYIPNQALIPACSPYTRKNLGCNTYSDGTVTSADSVAHEYMEAVTDPHIDAWYDNGGAEIADKCNFDYQACVTLANGSSWQIQSEWSNAINGCQQQ